MESKCNIDILENKKIVKELNKISKKYKLDLLIIFGSRSNNTYKDTSDFDFAFYKKKELSKLKELNLYNDITKILKFEKVDLININNNYNSYLRCQIFETGKVLYQTNNNLFEDLKFGAWMDYQDFKPYMKSNLNSIKNRLKDLGA